MARRPNYGFEKHQKELKRQKKKEEKAERKRQRKEEAGGVPEGSTAETDDSDELEDDE
ncbi:MAG: hypothetical protein WD766_06080 [Gemmatimonadota bacterium]